MAWRPKRKSLKKGGGEGEKLSLLTMPRRTLPPMGYYAPQAPDEILIDEPLYVSSIAASYRPFVTTAT